MKKVFRKIYIPAMISLGLGVLASGCNDEDNQTACPTGEHADASGRCVKDEVKCPTGEHADASGRCVKDEVKCPTGEHADASGRCVKDEVKCPTGEHADASGRCVKDEVKCPTGEHADASGRCVKDSLGEGGIDPCANMLCKESVCSEGVCVTAAMKAIQAQESCNAETFVEFCDGKTVVYCDQGFVVKEECPLACAVYTESFFGAPKLQAGCVDKDYDGGVCTKLNELKTECQTSANAWTVMATACQKTTRNTLRWISVDGYYCQQGCNPERTKCALAEDECDPYDISNYSCDRKTLKTCYLDSNLMGHKRNEYCSDACVTVGGVSMCGYACDTEGAQSKKCVTADSNNHIDSGVFYCKKTDSGALYSVWSKDYELCAGTCVSSTGECD